MIYYPKIETRLRAGKFSSTPVDNPEPGSDNGLFTFLVYEAGSAHARSATPMRYAGNACPAAERSVTGVWNLVFLLLAASSHDTTNVPAPNWSGQYAPCNRHPELLNHGHVNLGVRISTANPELARQFERAMEFWKGVLDLDWHEEDSDKCSVQVLDGEPDLFDASGIAARSQFPDRPEFQGWVAFNPGTKLTEHEMFIVSVHEIGHLLGLAHNPSGSSVMYFFRLDGPETLDASDLNALADRHKLRSGIIVKTADGKEGEIVRPVAVPY